jgi:MtaA/CmuA family methyltransferase
VEELTGRELVEAAFRGQETDRAPWVPFVGCHAAALLGVPADEYLKSARLMVQGVGTAIERYQPDGIPVIFDLQVEAEVLGCQLKWAADTPPSVCQHPLAGEADLESLSMPAKSDGRLPEILQATQELRELHPTVALFGLVTGPFTLALHLLGTEIFMRMFDDPDSVHELMSFCQQVSCQMSRFYLESGCDVIAVVDPMTSQISCDQFEAFVTPHAQPVFKTVAELGGLSSFFVCGHAQQNVEAMCGCGPQNICVDENIPLDYVRNICRERGLSFGGNMKLTTVLLLGQPEDAERDAAECLEIGSNAGFVLAPGCDIPFDTPPENLEAIGRLVRDPYRQQAVRAMVHEGTLEDVFDMSQYGKSDQVIVDIITLDSEACAPCQYMVEAVQNIAPEFKGIVRWREHKIKYRESIVFMTSLFVKNVPTICIDGKITFVSQIPPKEELVSAIQRRINQKMRQRIREKQASIFVVGPASSTRDQVVGNVERAIMELGSQVTVSIVEDEDQISGFGIHASQLPAVVTARYEIKSTNHVPETLVVKEWIKAL